MPRNKDLVINMGGLVFPVKTEKVHRFPESRLSRIDSLFVDENGAAPATVALYDDAYDAYYDAEDAVDVANYASWRLCDGFNAETAEVTFERLPSVATAAVLKMIEEGEIHYGHENVRMCALAFKQELDFWMVPISSLEPCCRFEFAGAFSAAAIQADRVKFVRDSKNKKAAPSRSGACFQVAHMTLSLCVNFLYVMGLCVESLFEYEKADGKASKSVEEQDASITSLSTALSYINWTCVLFFLIQTVGHITILLMFAGRRTTKNILLIVIDVVVLVPVLVKSVLVLRGTCDMVRGPNSCEIFASLIGFVTMRIVRFSPFLQLVFFSIFSSWKEIVQFAMLLFGFSAVLAGFSLYIEISTNLVDPIEAFYFAVVSLLTVGFGDHAPVSTQLKILVAIVLILWLLSSTISLGIIMSNVSNISDTILNADKIKQRPQQRVDMQIRRMSQIKIAGV